jgi:hypothetical protein
VAQGSSTVGRSTCSRQKRWQGYVGLVNIHALLGSRISCILPSYNNLGHLGGCLGVYSASRRGSCWMAEQFWRVGRLRY